MPDYVINAGGVIAVWYEYSNGDRALLSGQVDRIYSTVMEILELAEMQPRPTSQVADQIALSRLHETTGGESLRQAAI